MMSTALLSTLIPVGGAMLGALAVLARRPSAVAVSAVQHFAAGLVFAAAAAEILPQLKHAGALWPVMIGGTAGVAAMVGLKSIGERTRGKTGLFMLIGVDILIDGVVLGLGFLAGAKTGLLLTIALTIEVLFLSLSVAGEMEGASPARVLGTTAALALALPVGTALAGPMAAATAPVVTGAFAFGLVALLYLVTEELLVEAHETPDRPWTTALFFAGFLGLILLEDIL